MAGAVVQPIHPFPQILERHVRVHVRRGGRVTVPQLFLHHPQVPGLAQQVDRHRVPAAVNRQLLRQPGTTQRGLEDLL